MVHIDPLCSLFVYSSELPEAAPVQETITCVCFTCALPMEKCLWGSRTVPTAGTTQGSLAFGCVTVLLAALYREVWVPLNRENALKTPFRSQKKKHHRRTFLPLKGSSPSLRDWDNVRCLCYRERGAALPERWHSRNILQDKHAASQKICSLNTCVTHIGLTVLWHLPHPVPPQSRWASIFWPWHHLWGQQCLGYRWRGLSAVAG